MLLPLLPLLPKSERMPLWRLWKVVMLLPQRLHPYPRPPSLLHDLLWLCVGMTALA